MINSEQRPRGEDTRNIEAALGGADAVEKTTYGTGKGTDPEAMKPSGAPAAAGLPGPSFGIGKWLLVAAIVIVVLVYASGILR